jgi:hypothetical protein
MTADHTIHSQALRSMKTSNSHKNRGLVTVNLQRRNPEPSMSQMHFQSKSQLALLLVYWSSPHT